MIGHLMAIECPFVFEGKQAIVKILPLAFPIFVAHHTSFRAQCLFDHVFHNRFELFHLVRFDEDMGEQSGHRYLLCLVEGQIELEDAEHDARLVSKIIVRAVGNIIQPIKQPVPGNGLFESR